MGAGQSALALENEQREDDGVFKEWLHVVNLVRSDAATFTKPETDGADIKQPYDAKKQLATQALLNLHSAFTPTHFETLFHPRAQRSAQLLTRYVVVQNSFATANFETLIAVMLSAARELESLVPVQASVKLSDDVSKSESADQLVFASPAMLPPSSSDFPPASMLRVVPSSIEENIIAGVCIALYIALLGNSRNCKLLCDPPGRAVDHMLAIAGKHIRRPHIVKHISMVLAAVAGEVTLRTFLIQKGAVNIACRGLSHNVATYPSIRACCRVVALLAKEAEMSVMVASVEDITAVLSVLNRYVAVAEITESALLAVLEFCKSANYRRIHVELDAIESVLCALKKHETHYVIVDCSLVILTLMSRDGTTVCWSCAGLLLIEDVRERRIEYCNELLKGVSVILSCWKIHAAQPRIHEIICLLLHNIASSSGEARALVVEAGGIFATFSSFDLHKTDARLARAGVELLQELAPHKVALSQEFQIKILQSLSRTLDYHQSNVELCAETLDVLMCMLATRTQLSVVPGGVAVGLSEAEVKKMTVQNRQWFAQAQGVRLVQRLLKDHSMDLQLVAAAFSLLATISSSEELGLLVLQENGVALIIHSWKQHLNQVLVISPACLLVSNLSVHFGKRQEWPNGGLALIVDVLRYHIDNPLAVARLCHVLASLAVEDQVIEKISELEGLSLIISALDKHRNQAKVALYACWVLRHLIGRDSVVDNRRLFAEKHGIEIMADILVRHMTDQSIIKQACATLRLVATEVQNISLMEALRIPSLVQLCLGKHSDNLAGKMAQDLIAKLKEQAKRAEEFHHAHKLEETKISASHLSGSVIGHDVEAQVENQVAGGAGAGALYSISARFSDSQSISESSSVADGGYYTPQSHLTPSQSQRPSPRAPAVSSVSVSLNVAPRMYSSGLLTVSRSSQLAIPQSDKPSTVLSSFSDSATTMQAENHSESSDGDNHSDVDDVNLKS